MDGKTLARIGAVVFIAIAITATAIEMNRTAEPPAAVSPPTLAPAAPNPLRESLRRCQGLGEAALRDRGCLTLWAEQRDRFLGLNSPAPAVPQSTTAETPGAATIPTEVR
ncbi:conjugal transfer protein TrbK [Mesorhizobium sp. M2A.F.Ca.ET.042.01.1.1]|uniref:putative entry exclusion protein TrbK-alt n=1 Tax=Mesorhizobium sp. M2A.F.Ca.ET.042.01.1.1 TaxID=2496745 RepID=UPI000FCB709B|nr:putative entry exclusion protein TrbK-alt [Mesorhizobium sp. M2A.F.Ca.ET.042.01.1.1]RUX26297.1 conjugal transfer protein TrbK [Mesorhizobium sp. M2A.F.Ca.ET.042.01.1.1]